LPLDFRAAGREERKGEKEKKKRKETSLLLLRKCPLGQQSAGRGKDGSRPPLSSAMKKKKATAPSPFSPIREEGEE